MASAAALARGNRRTQSYLAVPDPAPTTEPDARPKANPAALDVTAAPVFVVDSVEEAETPSGAKGDDWYRYVLKSDRSDITGVRSGSREQVHSYATETAERLNTRSALCQPTLEPARPQTRRPQPRPLTRRALRNSPIRSRHAILR